MTNIEILELATLPEHLIVIGGGYVGLEFAQAYRRFGSKVTILQHFSQLLRDEDPDVAEELRQILTNEGIEIITSANIERVTGRSGDQVRLKVETLVGDREIVGTHLLAAAGRVPNTSGIGLQIAGVELSSKGWIKVNHRLETAASNIWAIGECAGSPQFTHASLDDFRIIRDNLAGGNRSTANRLMPACLFTDPQVAHVGLSEVEARRRQIPVQVVRIPMTSVLRARTIDETKGFMKALLSPDEGRILGFTMIGAEAGEVMTVVQATMQANGTYSVLRDAIIAHPTMAEGLNVLFSAVKQGNGARQ